MVKRTLSERHRAGIPSPGLWAGPIAWIVSLQAKYSLVPVVCLLEVTLIHPLTLVTVLISAGGGYLSWRAWETMSAEPAADRSGGGRPRSFVAGMGVLSAALFTLLILMQGAAAFVFDGCER